MTSLFPRVVNVSSRCGLKRTRIVLAKEAGLQYNGVHNIKTSRELYLMYNKLNQYIV